MNSMPEKSQDSFSTTTSTASESSLSPVAAPPNSAASGFGFLNATPSSTADNTSDMMKVAPPSSDVSGFSFITPQPETSIAPTPSAPIVLPNNDIIAPVPTTATSAFNFLNSAIGSEPKPTPVPAAEPPTSAFSFLASSSSPPPATPTPVAISRPVDIFDTMPLPVPTAQVLTPAIQVSLIFVYVISTVDVFILTSYFIVSGQSEGGTSCT